MLGLLSGGHIAAAVTFVFIYGCATGLLTITRGTLPLVLFDTKTYGAFVGRLLIPSFILSAAAPILFAFVIDWYGARGAIVVSIAISTAIVAASLGLRLIRGKFSVR